MAQLVLASERDRTLKQRSGFLVSSVGGEKKALRVERVGEDLRRRQRLGDLESALDARPCQPVVSEEESKARQHLDEPRDFGVGLVVGENVESVDEAVGPASE